MVCVWYFILVWLIKQLDNWITQELVIENGFFFSLAKISYNLAPLRARISWDYGLNYIFFRNITFLFFKIESWNFQHLFEKGFRETSQNFNAFSSFRQFLFSYFVSVVWLSWDFVRFHKILFQTDAESFSFLSWKTKKFYS